jgi:hypothetical protein
MSNKLQREAVTRLGVAHPSTANLTLLQAEIAWLASFSPDADFSLAFERAGKDVWPTEERAALRKSHQSPLPPCKHIPR